MSELIKFEAVLFYSREYVRECFGEQMEGLGYNTEVYARSPLEAFKSLLNTLDDQELLHCDSICLSYRTVESKKLQANFEIFDRRQLIDYHIFHMQRELAYIGEQMGEKITFDEWIEKMREEDEE